MDQIFFVEYQPYIFLAIGLIALSLSVFWESSKSKLKQTGIPVDGTVLEQGFDNSFNSSSFTKDKIAIRFVTQTGEWITGVIKQDFQVFYNRQYKNGDTVKVFYDKANPSNFYVDTKQSELTGRLVFGLVGLIFILFGLYKLLM